MPSLRAIGYQIEQDNRQFVADDASSYHLNFWRNMFQHLGYWLTELIPSVHRQRVTANAGFLKLVQEYKPLIVAQYREYLKQFERWEQENRQYGCGSSDAIAREKSAGSQINQLTQDLEAKLVAIGWCYRPLPTLNELALAYEGYIRMDAAWTYWEQIERFLVSRSTR